jgi:hypothetical protein
MIATIRVPKTAFPVATCVATHDRYPAVENMNVVPVPSSHIPTPSTNVVVKMVQQVEARSLTARSFFGIDGGFFTHGGENNDV